MEAIEVKLHDGCRAHVQLAAIGRWLPSVKDPSKTVMTFLYSPGDDDYWLIDEPCSSFTARLKAVGVQIHGLPETMAAENEGADSLAVPKEEES